MRRSLLIVACLAVAALLFAADAGAFARRHSGAQPTTSRDLAPLFAEQGLDARALHIGASALASVPGAGWGLVLREAPDRTDAELRAIADFAARGGRVLVLGDAPAGARLGVSILPHLVVDPSSATPYAAAATMGALTLRVPGARPVVDGRDGARVLAATRADSFVDADGDGRATSADAPGPFAVLVAAPGGRLVVSGSSDWLARDDLTLAQNHAAARQVLGDLFPAGTRVLVDEPAAIAAPASALADAAARPWLGLSIGGALVSAGAIAGWPRRGDDPADVSPRGPATPQRPERRRAP